MLVQLLHHTYLLLTPLLGQDWQHLTDSLRCAFDMWRIFSTGAQHSTCPPVQLLIISRSPLDPTCVYSGECLEPHSATPDASCSIFCSDEQPTGHLVSPRRSCGRLAYPLVVLFPHSVEAVLHHLQTQTVRERNFSCTHTCSK